jgi:phenylalanyl-tRNA synthetase beta chain
VELPAGITAAELAESLVKVGIEEETIHGAAVTGPLVVGKVLAVTKEPQKNGKTINWCLVDVGPAHNTREIAGVSESDLLAADAPESGARGIVCGAHNFQAGDYVVVALPGTVLPGPFPIAARKTYGHVSDGMICSEAELGRPSGDSHGIIVLPPDFGSGSVQPGQNAIELLGLGGEVLEINITPDRGYQLSYRGIGREFALSTGATFTDPGLWGNAGGVEPGLAETHPEAPQATSDAFAVEVSDASPIHGKPGCDRFVTRIVRGINPSAPTPQWMVKRLEASGMRSISLPVDITNYVMLDLGQPIHAYDLDKVAAPIVVRRANRGGFGPGERLTTLDDVGRSLHDEDLLITDSPGGVPGARVLGLAGVMGGQSSEISDTTTVALIECAHFDPASVARTARRHKLPTEAAKRFERGVDPALPPLAAQRVVDLLVAYGGGVADPAVGDFSQLAPIEPIRLNAALPTKIVGVPYPRERVVEILEQIGARVTTAEADDLTGSDGIGFSGGPDSDTLLVWPPTWRPDLTEPVDLVEEIVRIDGYDRVPSVLAPAPGSRGLTKSQRTQRSIARALAEAGLIETLSYPFVNADNPFTEPGALRLANPLAEDRPHMRTSLLATLLETAGRNVSRGMSDFGIFEIGAVTRPSGLVELPQGAAGESGAAAPVPPGAMRPDEGTLAQIHAAVPVQPTHVAGVFVGGVAATGWWGKGETATWRHALEVVSIIANRAGVAVAFQRPAAATPKTAATSGTAGAAQAQWHPGRTAQIVALSPDGAQAVVGTAGELHPKLCATFGLPARTVAFELDLSALTSGAETAVRATPVSTYPAAKEDFAFVVPRETPAEVLAEAISSAAGELKEELRLFDIYSGEQLDQNQKSLAFSLRLRAPDRTLDPEDVRRVREAVIAQAATVSAVLRG